MLGINILLILIDECDNFIILLVAKDDRKVRIEVGYGLEGAISDVKSSRIVQNYIVPEFKNALQLSDVLFITSISQLTSI